MKKETESPKTRTLVLLYSSQPQILQICFKSKPINKIKSRQDKIRFDKIKSRRNKI